MPKKIEKDVQATLDALRDPNKVVVAQIAPAYFIAIAEMFDMEPGAISITKLVAALKRIGFHSVFDIRYSADLTIMEEVTADNQPTISLFFWSSHPASVLLDFTLRICSTGVHTLHLFY